MKWSINSLDQSQKEQAFWFCVYLSWLPIIYGLNPFPDINEGIPVILTQQVWLEFAVGGVLIGGKWLGMYLLLGFLASFFAINCIRDESKANSNLSFWMIAPLGLIFYSCFIFYFNELYLQDSVFRAFGYLLYFSFVVISFVTFLWKGHLLSQSFSWFMTVIVLDVVIYKVWEFFAQLFVNAEGVASPLSFMKFFFTDYNPSLFNTIIFVISLLLMRVIAKAILDNRQLFLSILEKNPGVIKSDVITAAKLWWPMPVIFVAFSFLYFFAFNYAEQKSICFLIKDNPKLVAIDEAGACTPNDDVTLQDALSEFAVVNLEGARNDLAKGILDAKANIKEKSAESPGQITSIVDNATNKRLPGTRTESCRFNPVCYIVNGIKSMANSAYQNARKKAVVKMRSNLVVANTNIQDNAEATSKILNTELASFTKQTILVSQFSIKAIFGSIRAFSWLMFAYSTILLIRTYLMVLTRVLFRPRGDDDWIGAPFASRNGISGAAKIKLRGNTIKVPKSISEDRLYSNSGIVFDGPEPDKRYPFKLRFLIARWRFGKLAFYFVSKKRTKKTDYPVQISVGSKEEIVEWSLRSGEEVIFNFNNLIGFSTGVRFSRVVSLSLTTLIFGRFIYYKATGSGTLLLKTSSKAFTIASSESTRKKMVISPPLQAGTLVAWNSDIKVLVNSKLNTKQVLISPYNVQIVPDREILRDSNPNVVGFANGTLRFIKQFLLPI